MRAARCARPDDRARTPMRTRRPGTAAQAPRPPRGRWSCSVTARSWKSTPRPYVGEAQESGGVGAQDLPPRLLVAAFEQRQEVARQAQALRMWIVRTEQDVI